MQASSAALTLMHLKMCLICDGISPKHCLLTPLMSPEDRTFKSDWLIDKRVPQAVQPRRVTTSKLRAHARQNSMQLRALKHWLIT